VIIILGIIAIFVAYLSGSIPVGYVVARLYGVDVTASGSGRIGGTNVLRAAGPLAAGLTVVGDLFKGLFPVYFAKQLIPIAVLLLNDGVSMDTATALIVALTMPAAVLGHNYSIFLNFKGGVGAGTALGTIGGVHFLAAILAGVCALIALTISRYASILSTTLAVSSVILLAIFAAMGQIPWMYVLGAVLNLAVIVNSLRPNYARLRAGTERRVGQKTENIKRIS
jgi:glycerol-3-phosphate acyltransferase PlsY